jgi:Tol biopolymer transport system component/DNA-binding winged helix-turn-helix (wHTH) protein
MTRQARQLDRVRFFDFDDFRLDASNRLLLRGGEIVPLTPKVLDILLFFASNSGRVLEKNEVMSAVWADSFVEEGSLARNVSSLRRALGEDPTDHRYIVTLPGRGYRFVAPVRVVSEDDDEIVVEEHTSSRVVIEETEAPCAPDKPLAPRPAQSFAGTTLPFRQHLSTVLLASVVLATVSLVGIAIYLFWPQTSSQNGNQLWMRMERLISDRNCYNVAISPDGRFVAYVVDEGGMQALWLRQIPSGSDQQKLPLDQVRYRGLAFSLDGNYIYYVASHYSVVEARKRQGALYKLALIGDSPERIRDGLDSPIAISPDGKHCAFAREYTTEGLSALMVASIDGEEEERLATRQLPDYFDFPAWSPDGKVIACVAASFSAPHQLAFYEVGEGRNAPGLLLQEPWGPIHGVHWLKSGRLLIAAKSRRYLGGHQVWVVSYPNGEFRRVTNDASDYIRISGTADSRTLATVEVGARTNLWLAPSMSGAEASEITSGARGFSGLCWTPAGRIVYSADNEGQTDLWIMDGDGNNRKRLTFSGNGGQHPAVTSDGRYIFFKSDHDGCYNIWRMDSDGSSRRQLTHAAHADNPKCTPDGKWIVYTAAGSERWSTLWKAPLDGGEAVEISKDLVLRPAIAPNGKLIACFYVSRESDTITEQPAIALIPIEGGPPVKIFEGSPSINQAAGLQWTPDGGRIAYVDSRSGHSNIWSQPIDGRPPAPITDFKGDEIFEFAWSNDGRLAFLRGLTTSDVVLIKDFQ